MELERADGSISRLEYKNPTGVSGAGRMILIPDVTNTNAITNIVAQGLTEVMTLPARNVFHQTSDNTLRLAYRVTKPMSPGNVPAEIDVGVCLRNF